MMSGSWATDGGGNGGFWWRRLPRRADGAGSGRGGCLPAGAFVVHTHTKNKK